jgi:hypothetical protein
MALDLAESTTVLNATATIQLHSGERLLLIPTGRATDVTVRFR